MDAAKLSAATSVWLAAGPISSSGVPQMHDTCDSLTADLTASGASSGGSGGQTVVPLPAAQRRSFGQWLVESPGEEPLIPVAFAGACFGGALWAAREGCAAASGVSSVIA